MDRGQVGSIETGSADAKAADDMIKDTSVVALSGMVARCCFV